MLSQVYDVTPFLEDHPGGDEVLISSTGKEISSCHLLNFSVLNEVINNNLFMMMMMITISWQPKNS